jgi:methyltransferase (TIGR00027 family)
MIGSAYWIAAARARESARPDRLFDDPWAAALAGDRGAAALAASERATGGENPYLPVRTRYVDDAVTAALRAGIRQVVLLGAGLDTRAFRMGVPDGTTWYELDRPEVFAEKEPVLAAAVATGERVVVPADLGSGEWAEALRAAGHDRTRATLWVAEGLLFYLAADAVDALLAATASMSAPGSRCLADILPVHVPGLDAYRAASTAAGRPGPYGHDDPAALLAANGWTIEHLTWAGAPDANYGRFVSKTNPDRPSTGRAHLVTGVRPAPNPG